MDLSFHKSKAAEVDPQFYPDINASGSLTSLIISILNKSSHQISPDDFEDIFMFEAELFKGKRSAKVFISKHDRLFLIEYWSLDFPLAYGQSVNIDDAAKSVEWWVCAKPKLTEMKKEFPFIYYDSYSEDIERGKATELEWERIINWVEKDYPGLLEAAKTAYITPELRQLYPTICRYTYSIFFHRCTSYPRLVDCPIISSDKSGKLRVVSNEDLNYGFESEKYKGSQPLDADDAVRLVVDSLPENCGPAIYGTAFDIYDRYSEGVEVKKTPDAEWKVLIDGIGDDYPDLLEVVEIAYNTPELRQLYPTICKYSHSLNFSRCTRYPYTLDCLIIDPDKNGKYRVVSNEEHHSIVGSENYKGIKAINAEEAVKLVVDNLPENCGPAIDGTANDIK